MVKQKPNSYVVLQYTGLADSPDILQCSDASGDGIFHNISQLKAPVDQCFETQKIVWQIYVLTLLIREGRLFWVRILFGKKNCCS